MPNATVCPFPIRCPQTAAKCCYGYVSGESGSTTLDSQLPDQTLEPKKRRRRELVISSGRLLLVHCFGSGCPSTVYCSFLPSIALLQSVDKAIRPGWRAVNPILLNAGQIILYSTITLWVGFILGFICVAAAAATCTPT